MDEKTPSEIVNYRHSLFDNRYFFFQHFSRKILKVYVSPRKYADK